MVWMQTKWRNFVCFSRKLEPFSAALQAVIDWIWSRENQQGQLQNDLDLERSASGQYNETDATRTGLPQRLVQNDLDLERSASGQYDEPDAWWTGLPQRQVIRQHPYQRNSERWYDNRERRKDVQAHTEWDDNREHAERTGFQSRKRFSDDQNNSGLDDVVVPVKVAHLSIPVEAEKRFAVEKVHGYKDMPFLSDADTINYIKHSYTMFIMRGLPGSGKSTVAKCLQETYKESVTVCSADDFFVNKDGIYKFNASKLSEAHDFCQKKAEYHCNKGTRVVIIDNTNIQRWTMGFYVKLAQSGHHYHVVILEPQTPWRYEPSVLARRNIHNVDKETIFKKLQSLKDNVYRPMYYGWFLCKADSSMLVTKSREVLKQCVNEVARPDLSGNDDSAGFSSMADISENFVTSYTDPVPMLHCTAAYLARRSKDPYHTYDSVKAAMGRKFSLKIFGFVYSKKTLSARVCLQEDIDSSRSDGSVTAVSSQYAMNQTDAKKINQADLYMKDEEDVFRERYKDVHMHSDDSVQKHAIFKKGCSAHVTISYATDGRSKQSGDDILNILELEFYGKVRQKKTSLGLVAAYGKDLFQIQLSEPFVVNCLFQGFYSVR